MTSVTGARVFLSYNREDRHFARQLELVLKDRGYDPLVDVQAIVPGEPWQDRLTNMISRCDTVVFVLTERYLASEYCGWEISEARRLGKRMIPVLPRALSADLKVPDDLASLQYIYFYSDNEIPDSGFYVGMHKLEEALRLDLDWLRQKRRYEERATDWGVSQSSDLLLSGLLLEEAEDWARTVPTGNDVTPEIEAFIAASRTREDLRLKRARRARSFAWGAAVMAAGLMAASGYFWFQKEEAGKRTRDALLETQKAQIAISEQRNEIRTLNDDNAKLALAANHWADAKRQLALSEYERLEDDQLRQDPPLKYALYGIELVEKEIASLSEGAKRAHRATLWSMQRDLAKIHYFNQDVKAVSVIESVIAAENAALKEELSLTNIAQPGAGNTGSIDPRTLLMADLGIDYLSRAVFSCLSPDRRQTIGQELEKASADLFMDGSIKSSLKFITRNPDLLCEEAEQAICAKLSHEICLEEAPEFIEQRSAPEMIPMQQQQTIRKFQMVTVPEEYRIRSIVLHIHKPEQKAAAELFAEALRAKGYQVGQVELVSAKTSDRSIRYFYDVQVSQVENELIDDCISAARAALENASAADAQTQETLTRWTAGYDRLISLDGRYKGLRPDRVEIWF